MGLFTKHFLLCLCMMGSGDCSVCRLVLDGGWAVHVWIHNKYPFRIPQDLMKWARAILDNYTCKTGHEVYKIGFLSWNHAETRNVFRPLKDVGEKAWNVQILAHLFLGDRNVMKIPWPCLFTSNHMTGHVLLLHKPWMSGYVTYLQIK